MKRKTYLSVLLTAILVSGYLLVKPDDTEIGKDTEYSLVTVLKKDLGESVIATGIIKPKVGAEVKVGSQVSGIVKELYVGIGSVVKKNELLAQIEPEIYKAKLDQTEALKKIAATEKKYAELDLNRSKKLYQSKVLAEQQLENAEQRFDLACAKLNQAESDFSYASLQLGYTKITSPINGVVASINTQKGETVAASFAAPTFVTIIDLNKLELWAYVDETDIGRIFPDQKVSFTVDTYPEEYFEGTVETIYPKAEIQNNVVNYITVIKIRNKAGKILRPEMSATIQIFSEFKRDVISIPKMAVQFDEGNLFVYVLTDGKIEKRFIKTGISDKKYYEVLSGLSEKEKILIGEINEE